MYRNSERTGTGGVDMFVVLKIGGSLQDSMVSTLRDAIVVLQSAKMHVAVVHGGGPAISQALAEHKLTLPFDNGIRITTPEAMPIVESALWSHVNDDLTAQLRASGLPVARVNGADGLFSVTSTPMLRTGQIEKVGSKLIIKDLLNGVVPIICPLGVDKGGLRYNINADIAAAQLACALDAAKLIFCTDVPGIYADFEQGIKLKETNSSELERLLAQNKFTHGMIPKVEAVLTALAGSVGAVYVIDGRIPQSMNWAVADKPQVSSMGDGTEMGTRIIKDTANCFI